MSRVILQLDLIVILCILTGWSAPSCTPSQPTNTVSGGASDQDWREEATFIYAASSMSDFVERVSSRYRARYPKRKVYVELVGSHTARLQLERGAPPGVFISAAPHHVDTLEERGKVARQQHLTYNELRLVVRERVYVERAQTQANEPIPSALLEARWGLGDPRVPIGEHSHALLKALDALERVRPHVITYALSARALKGRAERSEIDVALLYRTDARSLKGWREIKLPNALMRAHRATYVIALTRAGADQAPIRSALDWWRLALSPESAELLLRSGFDMR